MFFATLPRNKADGHLVVWGFDRNGFPLHLILNDLPEESIQSSLETLMPVIADCLKEASYSGAVSDIENHLIAKAQALSEEIGRQGLQGKVSILMYCAQESQPFCFGFTERLKLFHRSSEAFVYDLLHGPETSLFAKGLRSDDEIRTMTANDVLLTQLLVPSSDKMRYLADLYREHKAPLFYLNKLLNGLKKDTALYGKVRAYYLLAFEAYYKAPENKEVKSKVNQSVRETNQLLSYFLLHNDGAQGQRLIQAYQENHQHLDNEPVFLLQKMAAESLMMAGLLLGLALALAYIGGGLLPIFAMTLTITGVGMAISSGCFFFQSREADCPGISLSDLQSYSC